MVYGIEFTTFMIMITIEFSLPSIKQPGETMVQSWFSRRFAHIWDHTMGMFQVQCIIVTCIIYIYNTSLGEKTNYCAQPTQ